MSDKTIKEFSEELGLSKQRIQQVIDKLPTNKTPNKVGNKYILSAKNQRYIKEYLGLELQNETTNDLSNSQLIEKDKQIENLHDLLQQQQKLLDQQQQLTLQANSQIQQLQEQLALTHEQSEVEEEESKEQIQEEVPKAENEDKKWWNFLKR